MAKTIPEWFHRNRYYLAILLIFYLFTLLLVPLGAFNTWISPDDHKGYYSITRIDPGDDTRIHAYLRSMVIDGDIDFFNEKGYIERFKLTPTGYVFSYTYAIGSAILWLPFFLIGHLIACIYSWLGYPFTTDGYSQPYLVMTAIGSASYFFMGLILLYDLLCEHFSKWISFLTVNVLWLATHLPFYVFIRSRMAHANEFFIITLFLYLWLKFRGKVVNWESSILFGATAALLALVHFENILFLTIFLIDTIFLLMKDFKNAHTLGWRYHFKNAILFISIFSCGLSVAFLSSKIIWGDYSLSGPVHSYGHGPSDILMGLIGSFSFNNLWRFFMAGDKGLFLTFPVWIFGLVGIILWIRRKKYLGTLICLGILIPLILCVLNPSRGAEYGIRRLSSAVPFLAFGVAMCFERISKLHGAKSVLGLIGIVLPFWAYIQIIQHKIVMEYNHPTFVITAFNNIPLIIEKFPELFLRSSSWMKLIFHKRVQLQSYQDVFFLVGFPVLQLMILIFLLIILNRIKFAISSLDISYKPFFRGAIVAIIIFFLILPVSTVVCNPKKTNAEIEERRNLQKEIGKLELKIRRQSIFLNDDQIFLRIAGSYIEQQKQEKAEEYLKKALYSNPGNNEARFTLAIFLQNAHRNEEAVEMYQEVLRMNPDHAMTYHNLAILYANEIKDYDKALSCLHKTIFLAPHQEHAAEIKSSIKRLTTMLEKKQ